jgi:hypothetical protein
MKMTLVDQLIAEAEFKDAEIERQRNHAQLWKEDALRYISEMDRLNSEVARLNSERERIIERCAEICDRIAEVVTYQRDSQDAAEKCADAIRALAVKEID